MAHNIRLFLVRHTVSAANLDKSVNLSLPDNQVPLDSGARHQGYQAGNAIAPLISGQRTRMLCSPYRRTRETAEDVQRGLFEGREGRDPDLFDYREELALREISFGLFDGIEDEELPIKFPLEHAHYQKHVKFEGEFFARMPMGESRVEVADRVKTVFGTILRDTPRIRNFIIVSHGVTIRTFIMQWLHLTPEWYASVRNPWNASVQIIESNGNSPYRLSTLFEGYETEHSNQQHREDDGIAPR